MPLTYDEAKRFVVNFAIVGITSAISKTISAPIDRIKVILQTQGSSSKIISGDRKLYTGILDCLVRLPREQGYLSFWRGNGVNVIRYFPNQALNFSFNDFFKNELYLLYGHDSAVQLMMIKFLSGGLAGFLSSSLLYPLEFCQTRIAADIGTDKKIPNQNNRVDREFTGLGDCIGKICKSEGYQGLYKGYGIAVLGITLYRAFYFSLFDSVKRLWAQEGMHHQNEVTKPPILVGFMLAQSVTITCGMLTYPLDTVGRRLMMDAGKPKESRLYRTTRDAVMFMYQHEGVRGFYRGIGANCLRGVSGALVLVFYDEILHYTNWKKWISSCDNC